MKAVHSPNPVSILEEYLKDSGCSPRENSERSIIAPRYDNYGNQWLSIINTLRHQRYGFDLTYCQDVQLPDWVEPQKFMTHPGYWAWNPAVVTDDLKYRCYIELNHSFDRSKESPFTIAELKKSTHEKYPLSHKIRPEMKFRFPQAYEGLRELTNSADSRFDAKPFAEGLANLYLTGTMAKRSALGRD
jgi:hypothetical protein